MQPSCVAARECLANCQHIHYSLWSKEPRVVLTHHYTEYECKGWLGAVWLFGIGLDLVLVTEKG